jgi:hypothetical protein
MVGDYCKIYLDVALAKDEVVRLVREITGGESEGRASVRTSTGVIDVEDNNDFDHEMRRDPATGFLYFRYYLDVEPLRGVGHLSYVEFLSHLLRGLRREAAKVVPACDFEHELPKE